jgi:hypothetical protein
MLLLLLFYQTSGLERKSIARGIQVIHNVHSQLCQEVNDQAGEYTPDDSGNDHNCQESFSRAELVRSPHGVYV